MTVTVLAVLGLVASRFGLSAIPAYLLAGLLLGPNEPEALAIIEPSEVTEFVAELGVIFLLFFLGLEFTLERFRRSSMHLGIGGTIDFVVNAGLGLVVGVVAFGFTFPAIILAGAIYVSSSAVAVKGLIDFRRLADDETDLVLAILIVEDIVIAFVLAFAGGGGGEVTETLELAAKAIGFIAASLAASRWLARPIDRLLEWMPREFFLLFTFALLIGMSALAHELGLSEAIGALMAEIILSDTSARAEIEEGFLSFRDIFAALFFFVFGLSIDVNAIDSLGWLIALAVVLTVVGKVGGRTPPGGWAASPGGRASTPARRWSRTASSPSSWPRSRRRTRPSGIGTARPGRVLRPLRAGHVARGRRAHEGVETHRAQALPGAS